MHHGFGGTREILRKKGVDAIKDLWKNVNFEGAVNVQFARGVGVVAAASIGAR